MRPGIAFCLSAFTLFAAQCYVRPAVGGSLTGHVRDRGASERIACSRRSAS